MGQVRVRVHAQTWELVEHGGDRTARIERAMPQQAHLHDGQDKKRDRSLAGKQEPKGWRHKLAVHHQGLEDKTEKTLSVN